MAVIGAARGVAINIGGSTLFPFYSTASNNRDQNVMWKMARTEVHQTPIIHTRVKCVASCSIVYGGLLFCAVKI